MSINIILVFILVISVDVGNCYIRRHRGRRNNIPEYYDTDEETNVEYNWNYKKLTEKNQHCWMRLNFKKHFKIMDQLDERYADVRKEYQDAAENDKFDTQMLEVMLKTRGAAEREIHNAAGDSGLIPAGINLGGYFMMRMPKSLLFFHRMKLRNNTHFRVTHLRNDLANLTLHARLSLNDLHLLGSYDRSTTDKDPSVLYYTPTYGQVEFLLKNVQYKIEGRYRVLKDRLNIILMISEIDFDDILMTYLNNASDGSIRLQRSNIDDFLIRLKSDLDKWLKDYFNDYLMYFGLVQKTNDNKYQQYDKERSIELNSYTDYVINVVAQRLRDVKSDSVKLPQFTIFTANSMQLLLKDGVLRGLDSLYRRSVATEKKERNIRRVDAVVGFSNLKVTYQYEALLAADNPVLKGMIILSADELTTRMELAATEDSESVDIQFEFMEQAKPESLTIEGAANRMIPNFKYILEQHIIAIMSNTLYYNIKMLGTVSKCVPLLHGLKEFIKVEGSVETNTENENNPSTDPNPTENIEKSSQTQPYSLEDSANATMTGNNNEVTLDDKSKSKTIEINESSNSNSASMEQTENQKENQQSSNDLKTLYNNKIILLEDNSANIELPSTEVKSKHNVHLKYTKNLTLTRLA